MSKPLLMPHKIEVKIDKATAGDLNTSSMKTSVEEGTVVGIGADVSLPLKVGDRIRFKSWGVDVFSRDNDTFYYIDERTLAIAKKI